jgi:acyl-CoA reductase-like NAD-dependent aldehyde dehydrogenase
MTSLVSFSNLVDGAAAPVSETFESYYPFTGKPWARIPRCKASDVDEAVSAVHKAFRSGPWRTMTPSARGRLLMRLAYLITANSDRVAALETRNNGKLISEMTAQVRYIAEWYRYFGGPRGQNRGRGASDR